MMEEEIFDVVLQSTGNFLADLAHWQRNPPPEKDFELNAECWIGDLPYQIDSSVVMDACDPAGLNFRPVRQYGCRYAFCRRIPERAGRDIFTWDSDGALRKVLFIARLIHPTTADTSYSARLFFHSSNLHSIVPGPNRGYGAEVYIAADKWRDWLSIENVESLRNHLRLYIDEPPARIRRGRLFLDHAFAAFYLDQRTASLVSALESLLKVERNGMTRQFTTRVPQLAKKLGLTTTADAARVFYDDRSVYVHGRPAKYGDVSKEVLDRYASFEQLVRGCLLKASTDFDFAGLFASDEKVIQEFGAL